ncbi:MAG: DUF2778 domain-containing protein [Deltaproteobacteria bacterium]|nr:DUF2778 domain-containing protein [Deltaproteobacteria bacterium]
MEISSGESQVCLRLKKEDDKLLLPKYSMMTFLLATEIEKINIRLLAKEIDPVSDDIGEQNLNIDTAASIIDAQQIETNITINGAGRGERNLIAVLDVKLAVSKSPGTAQIGDVEPNGWVFAKLASGALVPLASGTAVELKSIKNEREQFEILEGNYKGVTASITTDKNRFTHLCPLTGRNPASSLKLFRDRWILQINSLGEFAVLPLDARDMIFPGSYKISLPDAPHQGGRRLRSSAKHAESWFRIGDEGERYIHPGSRSKGCITVTDLTKWELIFQHLANSRLDEYHVGIMEVI